jgi:hypothetical protein
MKHRILEFETRHDRVASSVHFSRRLVFHLSLATAIVAAALGAGIAGYMELEGMSFLDAFLNSAMILSGMGPVDQLEHPGAKAFAGIYAIVCGLLFFAIAGLVLAPVFHRMLHVFHADESDDAKG